MGTISINPDADGDLHDASLHNDKFQTILNEINGNLDANNLANPNSFLTLTSFAGNSYHPTGPIYPWVGWTTADTVTDRTTQADLNNPFIPSLATSACNIMVQSQFQNTTGSPMTLHAGSFIYQQAPAFNSAAVILYAQSNTVIGNGWTDMATMTFNPNAGGVTNANVSAFATTPSVSLPNGSFFRVLVQNNAATALSGSALALYYACFTATFKIPHTN